MDIATAPARLARTPSWLVSQTAVHVHRAVTAAFTAADVRGYQYALLSALAEFGPSSQAGLGRRCGIDRSDVVAAVNDLAARDLVDRAPDPDDRRRNVITITPAGARRLRQLDKVVADVQDELFASLDDRDRGDLVRLLTTVLADLTRQ